MFASENEAMAEEISTRHVSKLDGQNFQTWKFQMNAIFIAFGLSDIVYGTRARPVADNELLLKAWTKDNVKAMFLISSSMESKQMESLLVCTTASEMWTKLSAIHEQRSVTNKLILLQRFHEYRMDHCDSVVQYIAKVQSMAMRLCDLEENISSTPVMAKIIASLPTKFNPLKTAWDSVPVEFQTVDSLT